MSYNCLTVTAKPMSVIIEHIICANKLRDKISVVALYGLVWKREGKNAGNTVTLLYVKKFQL